MRPCDVDRSGDVWVYRPQSHKTAHHGHSRAVMIGPKAQAVLLRYLARDAEANCFRPCDSEAKRRAAAHAARKTPTSCGNIPGSNRKRKPCKGPGESDVTANNSGISPTLRLLARGVEQRLYIGSNVEVNSAESPLTST